MTQYVAFELRPRKAHHVTDVWDVRNFRLDMWLGQVKWLAGWRRYVFMPDNGTGYDPGCLREIADFTEKQTQAHRLQAGG